MQLFYDSEILFDVPPEAFDIKPKVTSSFIRLIPKKNLNFSNTSKKNLFALIDLAFASRRKNIKNNLKKLNINWAKVDIDPTKRPEELTLESFIKLSEENEEFMSHYVIGDVQGCYDELMLLCKKIKFNPKKDKLIFAGDLVNRGPKSLEVLNFCLENKKSIKAVLGNHDFYLLYLIEHKKRNKSLKKNFKC